MSIIILGIVSYKYASEGIIDKYEKAAGQAVNMAGEYMSFGLESTQATMAQYINDEDIKKYIMNINDDLIANSTSRTKISNAFLAKKTTDVFIKNIHVLSGKVEPISTNISLSGTNMYTGFLEDDIGKMVKDNQIKTVWVGSNDYLDTGLKTTSDSYAMRLVRSFLSINAVLIIDIDAETVKNIIDNLEFDQSAIVGITIADGKEILAHDKTLNNSDSIIKQTFYQDTMATDTNMIPTMLSIKELSICICIQNLMI
ncbi:MAG: hypothetical protein ACK5LL_07190 [Suipraeoptans sp.]